MQLQLLDVVCSDVDQLMSCFLVKEEGRSRQSASIQPPCVSVCVCVCVRQCGLCVVCRDEESLPRSERHVGSFPWAWACVFITPTPLRTKVGVVCSLQFLNPLTELLASWFEMTSKHPYTLTARISLYQRLFVHQHVFPSIVLDVLNRRPEAISSSLSCAGFYHHAASVPH